MSLLETLALTFTCTVDVLWVNYQQVILGQDANSLGIERRRRDH